MKRPVVGITQCLDTRGRWRAGRTYGYLDAAYADAVSAAGGVPLLLPIQAEVFELAARIDGLLLPGGDDFDPPTRDAYPPDVAFDPAPAVQIEFDLAVLSAAKTRRLPVLGICYGMQLLAVQRGGSLLYDLPTDAPNAAPHQLPEPEGRHALEVVPATLLAEILGEGPHEVNSRHHQAIRTPGEGLRVSASAPDGVIEGIEARRDFESAAPADGPVTPFELGVQWHPENLSGGAGSQLFEALVAACAVLPRTG